MPRSPPASQRRARPNDDAGHEILWPRDCDRLSPGRPLRLEAGHPFGVLGQAVQLRMRGEVKAGEFDKAVASARTLFGLARMLETHPTLIGGLVGGPL